MRTQLVPKLGAGQIEPYQLAWIFCLPSSYEVFRVPYFEAMACGTQVVAPPNPGAMEVLDGGRFVLITKLELLGSSFASLLAYDQLQLKMTRNGLERARNDNIHQITQQYLDLASAFAEKRDLR